MRCRSLQPIGGNNMAISKAKKRETARKNDNDNKAIKKAQREEKVKFEARTNKKLYGTSKK